MAGPYFSNDKIPTFFAELRFEQEWNVINLSRRRFFRISEGRDGLPGYQWGSVCFFGTHKAGRAMAHSSNHLIFPRKFGEQVLKD